MKPVDIFFSAHHLCKFILHSTMSCAFGEMETFSGARRGEHSHVCRTGFATADPLPDYVRVEIAQTSREHMIVYAKSHIIQVIVYMIIMLCY